MSSSPTAAGPTPVDRTPRHAAVEPLTGTAIAAAVFGLVSAVSPIPSFVLLFFLGELHAADYLLPAVAVVELTCSLLLLCRVAWVPLLVGSLLTAPTVVLLDAGGPPGLWGTPLEIWMVGSPLVAALLAVTPDVRRWVASRPW